MAYIVRNGATGFPSTGGTVHVYLAGTQTHATGLKDLDGVAIDNTDGFTVPADTFWGFEPPTQARLDVWWEEQATYLVENAVLKDPYEYHGVEAIGSVSFSSVSKIFTIASGDNKYWYQGSRYVTTSAITCDLSSTTDRDHASATLTANTMYYLYFKDDTGKLYWSPAVWSLKTKVPVASLFWNGTSGAIIREWHNHTRNIDWHINNHKYIGARISPSDFAMTAPSGGSPTTVNFAGGTIADEDLETTHAQQTNCRIWYQTGASTFTFVDSNNPYPTVVSYVDTDNAYTLTAVGATDFINEWFYAAPDNDRGIYVLVEAVTAPHNTAAVARAVPPPSLVGLGLSPELKLLYRVIFKGDETFVEATDYRASGSLPYGGSAAPTAAAIAFVPTGNIAAVNVQGAIEELDNEKAAASHAHGGISTDGKIGTTIDLPIKTGTAGVLEAGSWATTPSTQAYGDSAAGGSAVTFARGDHKHAMPAAVTDATISTSDVTTSDASTTKHGWAPKVTAPAAGNLSVLGVANTETGRADKLLLDTTTPSTQAYGDSAAAGSSLKAARVDHKHAMPAAVTDATISTTDVTTNDASTTKHGWAPKVTAPAAGNLSVLGVANSETIRAEKLLLDGTTPSTQAFGDSAAAGSSLKAARVDHKHAMPALDIVGDTTPQLGGNLDLNSKAITEIFTAGENLAVGNVCYFKSDGKMWKTDCDAEATTVGLLAMATGTINANATGAFVIIGRITLSGLTAGAVYYVSSTTGSFTATRPSATGQQVRVIGYALSTTVLFFNPSQTWIQIV